MENKEINHIIPPASEAGIMEVDDSKRTIKIVDSIYPSMALDICLKLKELDKKSNEPIEMIINSTGGSVIDGLTIIDTMRSIKSPVVAICVGSAYSMASVLLMAADKRYMTSSSDIIIHEVRRMMMGQYTTSDVSDVQKTMKYLQNKLYDIIHKNSKITKKKLESIKGEDWRIYAKEAKKLGIVDGII